MAKPETNALGVGDVVAITAGPFKDWVGQISAFYSRKFEVAFAGDMGRVERVWFHREYVSRLQEPG